MVPACPLLRPHNIVHNHAPFVSQGYLAWVNPYVLMMVAMMWHKSSRSTPAFLCFFLSIFVRCLFIASLTLVPGNNAIFYCEH